MDLKQAIETLQLHNKWRKGADIPQLSPVVIGDAIDEVVCAFHGGALDNGAGKMGSALAEQLAQFDSLTDERAIYIFLGNPNIQGHRFVPKLTNLSITKTAMENFMYAVIKTRAIIEQTYQIDPNYTRKQESGFNVNVKIRIYPPMIEKFQELAGVELYNGEKISVLPNKPR